MHLTSSQPLAVQAELEAGFGSIVGERAQNVTIVHLQAADARGENDSSAARHAHAVFHVVHAARRAGPCAPHAAIATASADGVGGSSPAEYLQEKSKLKGCSQVRVLALSFIPAKRGEGESCRWH